LGVGRWAWALGVLTLSASNVHLTLPVFWTTEDKLIIAPFNFTADDLGKTIYEFDASTLKTVGAPFKDHTGLS